MTILLCTLLGCSRHGLVYLHVATIAFRLLLLLRAHNRMRVTTREGLQLLEENSPQHFVWGIASQRPKWLDLPKAKVTRFAPTAFCLGYSFSKAKVTRFAKNVGRTWTPGPSWLCLWCQNRLWARTSFVFNFTLDSEAYTSNQSIVATYGHVGFRAYCTLFGCVCVLDDIKINNLKILE